jgi:2'-5' RNA ligase
VHAHAAFVPPEPVRQALADLVTSLEPSPADTLSGRRGLFGRRTPENVAAPAGPLLEPLDPDRILLPITDFGYLASGDARRLVEALTQVCAPLPQPTIRVAGGAALVDPGDRSVWADVAGTDDELGAMRAIAQAVVSGVEPLGLFCDRRQFRPRFTIATITDDTTVEHLEQVLAELAAYSSEPWTIHEVAVLQKGAGVYRTVPIGTRPPG